VLWAGSKLGVQLGVGTTIVSTPISWVIYLYIYIYPLQLWLYNHLQLELQRLRGKGFLFPSRFPGLPMISRHLGQRWHGNFSRESDYKSWDLWVPYVRAVPLVPCMLQPWLIPQLVGLQSQFFCVD